MVYYSLVLEENKMTNLIAIDVPKKNPCYGCGACCAFFRATFHWMECESAGGTVPDDTVVQITPHIVAMKGTEVAGAPYCINLAGEIGKTGHCGAYETRSSTCREFDASYQNGVHEPRCDKARIKHGLPVVEPEDWH